MSYGRRETGINEVLISSESLISSLQESSNLEIPYLDAIKFKGLPNPEDGKL